MFHRLLVCSLFLVSLLGLISCGGDAIGDLLDPSKDDSEEEGFRRGVGGGSVIKDIFEGARFQRAAPNIVDVYPQNGDGGISIRSIVVITFSESMDPNLVNQESVTFRESGGSGTALLVDQIWAQNQTVLILAPQSNLQEQVEYEVTISGSLEDLQGQSLDSDGETRVTFTTGTDNSEVQFQITEFSPRDGTEFNYRGSPIIAFLSEPAVLDGGSEALNNTSNFVVRANGQEVSGTFEDAADGRIVQFVPDQFYPSGAEIDITISGNVVSQINRSLNRGTDFRVDFEVFPADSPTDIVFPNNRSLGAPLNADGFISGENLRSFDAQVNVEEGSADVISLAFVDVNQTNGLLFQQTFEREAGFSVDLQPEESVEALADGDVFVGAYGTFRGVNGAVDVVRVLVKDTEGFGVSALGPPNGGAGLETTLVTPLAEPILQGQLDQPGAALSITGTGDLSASAITNLPRPLEFDGQTTFTEPSQGEESLNNSFITQPIEGLSGLSFDPVFFSGFTGQDAFANEDSGDFVGGFLQAGIIGGATAQADTNGGLVVEAVGEDTFTILSGTDVIVEAYPRDETLTGQILLEVPDASFNANELANLGTDQITVTLIRDGYHIMTLQGLPNPARTEPPSPYGIRVILEPATLPVTLPVEVNSDDQDISVVISSNVGLYDDRDSRIGRSRQPRSLNEVLVRPNRLKAFSLIGTRGEGSNPDRFLATAVPVFADDVASISFDLTQTPVFRNGQSLPIELMWDPSIADTLNLVDSGSPTLDLSRIDLLARLPGFDGAMALGFSDVEVADGEGTLRLPNTFIQNATPSDGDLTEEDTPLEIILQPDLAGGDSSATVSGDILRDSLFVSLSLRDAVTDRVSVLRSEIDFSTLASPQVILNPLSPPVVPEPLLTSPNLDITHPPTIPFSKTLSDESLYQFSLIQDGAAINPENPGLGTYARRWDLFTVADLFENDQVFAAFPVLENADPSNDITDFQNPGTYGFEFQGFDLDNESRANNDVDFDFSSFTQSQLLRSAWKYVRYPVPAFPTVDG